VVVRFILDERYLTIIDTHPPPPKSYTLTNYRNHQLEDIAEFVSGQTGDVMVLGDLNTTPWSPFFQEFLRRSSLRESRNGFGLQLSWPTDRVPFLVPIDHILVSKGIIINKRRVGPNIGSDHFPVILSFSMINPTKE
jgi:endonuclease/exonuclease/phosphatase (EEP) superfamily protein YafD